MKKLLITVLIVSGIGIYALFVRHKNTDSLKAAETSGNTNTSGVGNGSSNQINSNSNTNNGQTATSYKNGGYTGSVEDAFYGSVQVSVKISGNKIASVNFLQYPSDAQHSQEISSYAMPQLKSEAISAQSANVDIVSGATQTSLAFQRSLQNALTQAQ